MSALPSPTGGQSEAASITTDGNDHFDDAQSHVTDSAAGHEDSRPETPTQAARGELETTPKPARQGDGENAPATTADSTPERAAGDGLLRPGEPERKFDSEQTTLNGAAATGAASARSGGGSAHESAAEKDVDADAAEKQAAPGIGIEHYAPGAEKDAESSSQNDKPLEKVDTVTTDGGRAAGELETAEDEAKYISGLKLWLLTFGLFVATFVIALDNTIIATAIPKITTQFDSLGDVGWYGSSYLLTTTSLQPSFGKIYTYFSIKWTYVAALIIFEVGSIVCATAQSSVAFIVGRAVAGVGASALFSGGMTIIGFSVPLRRRAFYIAVLSSTFGIASVVGPLLGGVFTDSAVLTWRFCFWINLPFGALAILAVILFFRPPERKHSQLSFSQKIRKMDLPGALILIGAIVSLLLALQWGGTTYPWSNSKVWGCLLGFGLLLIVFISMQLYSGDDATVPPRVISKRGVAVGCAFSAFLSMALYVHIYYLPFYFQAVQGTSAEGSGIRTIPYLVSTTLASIVVGGFVTTFGPYAPFLWVGSAIFTVGAGMLHMLAVGDGPGRWIGFQILAGIGAGAAIQIPFIAVQVVCSAKDMPTGNALTIFFNSLGGALSISIAQNIFSNELYARLSADVPPVVAAIVASAGATNVYSATPAQYLPVVLADYDAAITKAFILAIAVGGIAFLVSLLMPWGSVKGKKIDLAGGA